MHLQPKAIWLWWQGKSLFQKILMFLPVLLLLVVAFGVCFFLQKGAELIDVYGNPSKETKDKREEFYEKYTKEAEEEKREITKKINIEKEKRKDLEEKKISRESASRKNHEAINNALSFDDIDHILDKDLRERK